MGDSITEMFPWMSEMERRLREGVQSYFQKILEDEASQYVSELNTELDKHGHRLVKRNGYMPKRRLTTTLGPISFRQPRVRDSREGHKFTSRILPPYLRKAPCLENLIPALYLRGISMNDFPEALESILGPNCKGLSPKSIERLKSGWVQEYEQWRKRELKDKVYSYIWADGIHFNVRLADAENKRMCFLVLMGATSEGKKELIGVMDGVRESKASWQSLLLSLKKQGMQAPKLAIGDGALGFWAALEEVFSETKQQRCWVHKTANILDKLPKSVQPRAKQQIHDIYKAPTRKKAKEEYETFLKLYEEKYPRASKCLKDSEHQLFSFYDFPAVHWQHIRSTNPIESLFATVRLRTKRTKGSGSRVATMAMVFKLCQQASKRWRRLRGYQKLEWVQTDVQFIDGYTAEEWEEIQRLEKRAA